MLGWPFAGAQVCAMARGEGLSLQYTMSNIKHNPAAGCEYYQ